MRCKFCGSKAIYPCTQHEQATAGRVVAGAIIAGAIGAAAGLAGKNVKGYRCSACGMFSEQPMDFGEEMLINSAVNDAKNGKTVIYERYQEKYANLEFVPVRQVVNQESDLLSDEDYDEDDVELLPEAEPVDESIKHSYCPNQYVVGSPVFISNVTIKDDNGTDALLLDINNISGKTLRSAYLNITVYDDVGDQISTSTFAYQGLSAATGETLPQAKPFNLNTNVAYKVDVTCEKAAFTDDSVWRKEENPTIYSVPEKTELVPESFAQHKYLRVLLAKKGALRVGQKLYYPVAAETHRLCVCGNPAVSGSKCLACGLSEADLQEVMDYDVLIQCRKDVIAKTAKERTEALRELCTQVQEDKYQEAIQLKEEDTLSSCSSAMEIFASMAGYKDADKLCVACKNRTEELKVQAEIDRKDRIYATGKGNMSGRVERVRDFEAAITEFEKIPGWKDADEQVVICQKKIEELKIQAEEERRERERKDEIARAEAAAAAKRKKVTIAIVAVAVCVAIAFLVVLNTIIIPDGKYNDAIALMESGKYSDAISAFEALDGYKESTKKIEACKTAITENKYSSAIAFMEAGEYSDAITLFKELGDYRDSEENATECTYNIGIALMTAEKYAEAIDTFTGIKSYKDCIDRIIECRYCYAVALMDASAYYEALDVFQRLGDYQDSTAKIAECHTNLLKTAKVGSYVFLGEYEQDNNKPNGSEPVEWLVLEIKNDQALVISKYAIDCQKFSSDYRGNTWETCSLRQWLNNDFLSAAFSSQERDWIVTITVNPDENPYTSSGYPGNATQDKVFLLSIKEYEHYFERFGSSAGGCTATAYAEAQGVQNQYHGKFEWWLRTHGDGIYTAAVVYSNGHLESDGAGIVNPRAVRPAMWIDLSKIK